MWKRGNEEMWPCTQMPLVGELLDKFGVQLARIDSKTEYLGFVRTVRSHAETDREFY